MFYFSTNVLLNNKGKAGACSRHRGLPSVREGPWPFGPPLGYVTGRARPLARSFVTLKDVLLVLYKLLHSDIYYYYAGPVAQSVERWTPCGESTHPG